MKWCFLVNQVDILMEFLGKLADRALQEGDECLIVANSKIAEYSRLKFFPLKIQVYSRADWLSNHYEKGKGNVEGLTWKEFFPSFDRKRSIREFHYEDAVGMITQTYQFLDFVFQTEKPDAVVSELPANLFSEVAYHLCRKYALSYLGFTGSKMNGRFDIFDQKHTCSKYEETYRKLRTISKEEETVARSFLETFLPHEQIATSEKDPARGSYLKHLWLYLKREGSMVQPWLRYLRERATYKEYDYESEVSLKVTLLRPWKAFLRIANRLLTSNMFDKPREGDIFFLFPLQLKPEASTSALATYFSNQLQSVQNVAFSLPFPCKLYVKEHPAMIGTNTRAFYRKLKEIPNVVLLSAKENVPNLIKKSEGVITLTSTIGFESALAGKLTYVLGNVFYSYHPACKRVKSFEELREVLQQDIKEPPRLENLQDINIRFLASYFRNTIPGEVYDASRGRDLNDYQRIYQEIKKIFFSSHA